MPNYSTNNKVNTTSSAAKVVPYNANPIEIRAVPAPNDVIPQSSKTILPSAEIELRRQGYTNGLIQSIANNKNAFPIRIWVVDNSGSMSTFDGHKISRTSEGRVLQQDCSRWNEIVDTVSYHAKVAANLEAPTEFRLLNPQYKMDKFEIAMNGTENIQEDLSNTLDKIRMVYPCGVTPLAERVVEISSYLHTVKDQLIAKGQKAVVVLATDGLPSDGNGKSNYNTRNQFKQALRSMEGLPVWLVIRLCTDSDDIIDFYNNIDAQLEMSCDVLDDFNAEALEVYEHNKWLNYALPLHRMREMGFYHKLFDLIDERPLTKDELKDFFLLIFGADKLDGLPDPQLDWERFIERVGVVNNQELCQWNPVLKRMMPWINMGMLQWKYGPSTGCFCF